MQGPEAHYALCEEVAREIYKPVMRSHRVTVEQLAILEPALSETVGATLALALREATDEAVRRGVPSRPRTTSCSATSTSSSPSPSASSPRASSPTARCTPSPRQALIFRDDWLERVFAPEAVLKSVQDICHPEEAA